ncbi:MAG: HNH endonuclease [Bulleidia sp.]
MFLFRKEKTTSGESRYLFQKEQESVLSRDRYTCQVCGKSVRGGVILHTHHIRFWKNYRSDRISSLLTVCEYCHTAKNHQPGGKLWGWSQRASILLVQST